MRRPSGKWGFPDQCFTQTKESHSQFVERFAQWDGDILHLISKGQNVLSSHSTAPFGF
jgi:tricorn protease-like protein